MSNEYLRDYHYDGDEDHINYTDREEVKRKMAIWRTRMWETKARLTRIIRYQRWIRFREKWDEFYEGGSFVFFVRKKEKLTAEKIEAVLNTTKGYKLFIKEMMNNFKCSEKQSSEFGVWKFEIKIWEKALIQRANKEFVFVETRFSFKPDIIDDYKYSTKQEEQMARYKKKKERLNRKRIRFEKENQQLGIIHDDPTVPQVDIEYFDS